jgi:fibronectin-binding autotransporter adhesin
MPAWSPGQAASSENWSDANWSQSGGPGTTDTASFTDTGSVSFPGTVTSILNADRTIGGLAFADSGGHYQTLSLNGFTLSENGNLNFNADQNFSTTTTILDGILNVGGSFSSVYVGSAVSKSATGAADLSGLTSFGATLQNLLVGESSSGSANGTLTLSPSNTITAQLIQVGAVNNASDSNGTLHLGLSNTVTTPEFDISQNNASGTVTIVNGGSLSLGSSSARTLLQIGSNSINTNNLYPGVLNLTGGSLTAYLSSLIIGQDTGGAAGGCSGNFTAGTGTLDIGAPGNTANFYAGNSINSSGSATGIVNFGSLSSLNANLNTLGIGTSIGGGAQGTVQLAATNTINATNIIVGSNGNGNNTLSLGHGNTILVNQFTIGQNYSNATVTLPANGTLTLGSSTQLANLSVGIANTNTNNTYTGTLDLSQGTFNGYLSSLTVGQQIGPVGNETGNFFAGNSGSLVIGAPNTNIANLIVANQTNSGASTNGTANFGGLTSLTTNLNNFTVGTATTGFATGAVVLAASNYINANNVVVGSGGNNADSLVLGFSNKILTNQFTIGQDYSTASVTIPSGGSLTLGSSSAPVNLTIAMGNTNTNNNYGGSLDLTNATLTAYLGNVIIGLKNPLSGSETGIFTISSNPNNYIVANTIALGGNESNGTINYGGGVFYAGSISAGPGNEYFNWTGGTLSVGTYGSPSKTFDLKNTGSGTLAPGSASGAIGTTAIYGNYTQGVEATTAIRIAGDSPSTGNDQVNISQAATLAGDLNLSLTNSFVPSVGQNFLIETYASHSGSYAFVAPPSLPQSVAFQLDYTTNSSQLVVRMVAPVVQNYISKAAVGSFGTASSWDTNATPNTPSSTVIDDSGTSPQTVTVSASTTVQRVMLSGTGSPLNFEVPQGIQLGVANQLVVGTNATLSGGGHIYGDIVVDSGTVSPGAAIGDLTVSGNYTMQPASTLRIYLGGSDASNQSALAVNGLLTLDGTLQVVLDGFTPSLGNSFPILSFGASAGEFANYDLPSLPQGLAWNESQLSTTGELTVVAVPEPANLAPLFFACTSLLRHRRRTSRT